MRLNEYHCQVNVSSFTSLDSVYKKKKEKKRPIIPVAPTLIQTIEGPYEDVQSEPVSNLVVWEIVRQPDLVQRTAVIEKWVAVADICRCLHNYNGILEIASALNRSAVFRLKKTWARVSKHTKGMIEKLQKIVSSEGRFKNLREALKSCDALCVPYLGMYLTDLAMIEEGTSNFTPEGLVNFSKVRLVRFLVH
uniref:ras-specific guanine nucleotide-releasing factor 1-like n=1 Tax=Myxine glutinosa TaxID=7769 RepID=UPI00358EA45D